MSDEDGKVTISLTAKIVVNKYVRPPDLPEYCVDSWTKGEVIDLRPLAADALDEYPGETSLDIAMVSRLTARLWNGAYIRVADYPAGVDRELLKRLAHRIQKRAWVINRRENELPSMRFPFRTLSCDEWACPQALALRGKLFDPAEVPLLPFSSCWQQCRCGYEFAHATGS